MATENFEASNAAPSAPEPPNFDAIGLLAEGQTMNFQSGSQEGADVQAGDPEGPNTNSGNNPEGENTNGNPEAPNTNSTDQLLFNNPYPRSGDNSPKPEPPKPRDLETRWRPNGW